MQNPKALKILVWFAIVSTGSTITGRALALPPGGTVIPKPVPRPVPARVPTRPAGAPFFQIALTNTSWCVDLEAGNTAVGTRIQLWDCQENNKNQLWTYTNSGDIRSALNWNSCIQLNIFRPDKGALVLADCLAQASNFQKWNHTNNDEFRLQAVPNQCLVVKPPLVNGGNIDWVACTGGKDQKWVLREASPTVHVMTSRRTQTFNEISVFITKFFSDRAVTVQAVFPQPVQGVHGDPQRWTLGPNGAVTQKIIAPCLVDRSVGKQTVIRVVGEQSGRVATDATSAFTCP